MSPISQLFSSNTNESEKRHQYNIISQNDNSEISIKSNNNSKVDIETFRRENKFSMENEFLNENLLHINNNNNNNNNDNNNNNKQTQIGCCSPLPLSISPSSSSSSPLPSALEQEKTIAHRGRLIPSIKLSSSSSLIQSTWQQQEQHQQQQHQKLQQEQRNSTSTSISIDEQLNNNDNYQIENNRKLPSTIILEDATNCSSDLIASDSVAAIDGGECCRSGSSNNVAACGTITTVTRSKRKTAPLPRLVAKNGNVNLFLNNIDRRQYVRDLFTTMIDIKWRYNLLFAAFGFVFSWLFFACIWYLVLYIHNDLSHENDPNWSPCIVNVNSFSAALLFSIETQSTLGFGSRIISVECPSAILIFCTQLIFGVLIECLIVGMVFAKLSRPAKRSQTIMYSKYATICLREDKLCLTFRVGDVRSKSHIIGATITASLVSQKITKENEIIPFYHHQLDVKIDQSKNNLLLIWPVTIVHIINRSSPFYKLNFEQLTKNFKFEIITVIEGIVESTGQSIQVRSSYLPSEVKWGYRFEPIVSTHGFGKYSQTIIDYNKFNKIIECDTPKCSAMEYYEQKRRRISINNGNKNCNASNNNNNNNNNNNFNRIKIINKDNEIEIDKEQQQQQQQQQFKTSSTITIESLNNNDYHLDNNTRQQQINDLQTISINNNDISNKEHSILISDNDDDNEDDDDDVVVVVGQKDNNNNNRLCEQLPLNV